MFDPASLTEDYEIGLHVHQCGHGQLFGPLKRGKKGWIATREYFPRRIRSAIRQRTRWVTGISLQCWERSGWRGSFRTKYWFWRDRKGLLASPLTFLTNVLFMIGLTDLLASMVMHRPWAFAVSDRRVIALCVATLALQALRTTIRMICVGRIFGLRFALGAPARMFHGNLVNCVASFTAMWRYAHARWEKRPLVWVKTEHTYPSRDALVLHRRELADVLVSSGYLSEQLRATVQEKMAAGEDLGDFLLLNDMISDDDLCKAISLQSGVPTARVEPRHIRKGVVRSLPAHVEKRFGIVPFELQDGRLFVAGPRVPPSSLFEELKSFTRLPVEFQLVTRRNYEELLKLL